MPPRNNASAVANPNTAPNLGRRSTPCVSRKDTPPRNPTSTYGELPERPHFFGASFSAEEINKLKNIYIYAIVVIDHNR